MGPSLIFDKSFLQGLNIDEAVWLDNFFNSNITPIFFIEVLADLEKEVARGRSPEDVVGNLAYKTPDMSSKCNAYHLTILASELSGTQKLEMDGRPIITGGEWKELDGKTGVIFKQSPEEEAFSRWHNRKFLELERQQAKSWRRGLSNLNLEETYDSFQSFFPLGKPKTLGDVKKFVDFHLNSPDQKAVLACGLTMMKVPEDLSEIALYRWRQAGKPLISEFTPYFLYLFSVDLFFNLAIASGLIEHSKSSNKIDLAYLYYLPFCRVFVSNDKLHAKIAPIFLKDSQTFISGEELKTDLSGLDDYYSKLPEEVRIRGIMSFAFYPPTDKDFLVSTLWDKYMSSQWRERAIKPSPQPKTPQNKEFMEELDRFTKEGNPLKKGLRPSLEPESMVIERKAYGVKGKWKRFPPEVLNRRKNEKGEWEDVN